MFKLRIETKNAAFEGDTATEVARILKEAVTDVEIGREEKTLHDINGNVVGFYTLTNR